MTQVGKTKRYRKSELGQMLQNAEVRMQVLETGLRQIAEEPSDDPATLQQLAATTLKQAGEARSTI
jgi:hypothetical protein